MKKVLIVDDNDIFRNNINLIFSENEHIKVTGKCRDGDEVLNFLDIHPNSVDVILMDINMKRMNGLEAAKQVKSKYPKIRVIMYSTYDSFFYKKIFKDADDFVCKYDDFNILLNTILN